MVMRHVKAYPDDLTHDKVSVVIDGCVYTYMGFLFLAK